MKRHTLSRTLALLCAMVGLFIVAPACVIFLHNVGSVILTVLGLLAISGSALLAIRNHQSVVDAYETDTALRKRFREMVNSDSQSAVALLITGTLLQGMASLLSL